MHTPTHAPTRAHTRPRKHTRAHTHTRTHTRPHAPTQTHAHTHTHTHTHTHKQTNKHTHGTRRCTARRASARRRVSALWPSQPNAPRRRVLLKSGALCPPVVGRSGEEEGGCPCRLEPRPQSHKLAWNPPNLCPPSHHPSPQNTHTTRPAAAQLARAHQPLRPQPASPTLPPNRPSLPPMNAQTTRPAGAQRAGAH